MIRIRVLTLLTALLVFAGGRGILGQEDFCPPDPGADCLGPAPLPELKAGWNLYWDDPCNPGNYPYICNILKSPSANAAYYTTVDFVPLMRDQSHSDPFATLGSPTNVVLGSHDLQTPFKAGTRATVGMALGDWYRLETTFLGGYDWNDVESVRNATLNLQGGLGSLRSPFSNFGNPLIVPGLDNNDLASVSIQSRLNSAEVNLRRRLFMPFDRDVAFEASFLIGARYMDISENFGYFSHSNGTGVQNITNQFNVAAQNLLVGPQIGLMGQFLLRPQTWIDVDAKGAAFNNHATQNSFYTNNNNGIVTQAAATAQRDRNAYLGDFAFNLNHQFTRTLTLRLGYNLLVVSNLALGSRNVNHDLTTTTVGPATINTNGRMTYHGPTLGLTWAF